MSVSSPQLFSAASAYAFRQTTLGAPVRLTGIGMHSGRPSTVIVRPCEAGQGVRFFKEGIWIPALAENVVNTQRATCLAVGSVRVDTVEHILSALHGMQIDNVDIEVMGPEAPILDGSALPWVDAFRAAGTVELDEEMEPIRPAATIALREGDSYIVAAPAEAFSLTCVIQFDHPMLGRQEATFTADPEAYASEIAPARTFGFAAEVEALREAGLAMGGSLDNALIIYEDRFSDDERVPNECLRHKLLDLWGDLYLAGRRIQASVTAIKPGHKINAAFADMLARSARSH